MRLLLWAFGCISHRITFILLRTERQASRRVVSFPQRLRTVKSSPFIGLQHCCNLANHSGNRKQCITVQIQSPLRGEMSLTAFLCWLLWVYTYICIFLKSLCYRDHMCCFHFHSKKTKKQKNMSLLVFTEKGTIL